jgi:putative ABC transport system ATP-binding protein
LVFRSFNLVPTLSGARTSRPPSSPLGVGHSARRKRTAAALAQVGLADRAAHLPSELSGGQQQCVAIARALVKEPKVLLADEATGNLDEDTRDDIITLLERLWCDRGLTLVLITPRHRRRPPGATDRRHEQGPPHRRPGPRPSARPHALTARRSTGKGDPSR